METQMCNQTVYLIDDDDVFLNIGKRILNRSINGLDVVCFNNPQMAFDSLSKSANLSGKDWPTAIILDIHLPVMDAWEFLGELEKLLWINNRQVEVWIVTASVDPADYVKALSYPHVTRFFRKPFQIDRFEVVSHVSHDKMLKSA